MAESKAAAEKKAEQERLEAYGTALIAAIDDLLTPPGAPVTIDLPFPGKVEEVTAVDPATDEEYTYDSTVYEAGVLRVTIAATV